MPSVQGEVVREGKTAPPAGTGPPSGGSRSLSEGKAGQGCGMQWEHGGGWWEGGQRVRRGGGAPRRG